jgi:hypothetical protein
MQRPAKPRMLVRSQPLPPTSQDCASQASEGNDMRSDIARAIQVSLGPSARTAVLAGHYCLSPELASLSSDQETEEACFACGAEIVRKALDEGGYSKLVLWINDIGIDTEERARIKQDYQLPDNYQRILVEAGLVRDDLQVLFESASRNKASTALRQLAARKPHLFRKVPSTQQGLVRCIDNAFCSVDTGERDAYVITGPAGNDLVVKEGPNPKCNLILATLYNRICTDHRPDTVINIFNSIYVNRIALGIHVARSLYDNAVPMINLFCYDTEIIPDSYADDAPCGEREAEFA